MQSVLRIGFVILFLSLIGHVTLAVTKVAYETTVNSGGMTITLYGVSDMAFYGTNNENWYSSALSHSYTGSFPGITTQASNVLAESAAWEWALEAGTCGWILDGYNNASSSTGSVEVKGYEGPYGSGGSGCLHSYETTGYHEFSTYNRTGSSKYCTSDTHCF